MVGDWGSPLEGGSLQYFIPRHMALPRTDHSTAPFRASGARSWLARLLPARLQILCLHASMSTLAVTTGTPEAADLGLAQAQDLHELLDVGRGGPSVRRHQILLAGRLLLRPERINDTAAPPHACIEWQPRGQRKQQTCRIASCPSTSF